MRSELRLIRLGAVSELRSPGLRIFGLSVALAAAAFTWNQGAAAGMTALVTTTWLARILGAGCCLWLGQAAVRDQDDRLGAVVRSKPVAGARWAFVVWATGITAWMVLLAVAFAAAAAGEMAGGSARAILGYSVGFLRAIPVVLSVASLGFVLSRIMRSPLGGILMVFAWFCVLAGLQNLPTYLRPDYSQNIPLFLVAAAALLVAAAFGVERFRRGELRSVRDFLVPIVAFLVLCTAAAATAARTYRNSPEQLAAKSPLWGAIQHQDLNLLQRAPGYWIPNGHGGQFQTAPYQGKILLIYLFASQDPGAAGTLALLDRLGRELGPRGVQPLGICFSEDRADAWALSLSSGLRFPIIGDPSVSSTTLPIQSSLAQAYRCDTLPVLIVTDRRRIVRNIEKTLNLDLSDISRMVDQRLAEEPE